MIDDRKFLAFGGGVQSTAIVLLLIHKPEIFTEKGLSLPRHLLFSDTGAEPPTVYNHIRKVKELIADVT
jgi:3'-phosphoadenosine 5'-phosphosulfate sulfotransferase (PAPS reductase)/FAD synthetase